MGVLRLFLAISVVVAHTGPLLGLQLMPSFEAVRIFFAISGFYMALVLDTKYAGRPLLFYSNRALRIYPAYWLALIATALLLTRAPFAGLSPAGTVVAAASNVGIFGLDLYYFAGEGRRVVVDPAWTLGAEVLFYALAPYLVRVRTWALVALAGASLGLQLTADHLHPWSSYFLFPANLCFFLYGVLGYRLSRSLAFERVNRRLGAWIAALTLLALIGREGIPLFRNYAWMHYAVAIPAIPFLFLQSDRARWDRQLGELSYPVYILHFAVILAMERWLGTRTPWPVLAVTLALAAVVYGCLDRPIDRWRAARAAGRASGPVLASRP